MKKLFAVLLALTLVLSMGTIALAADTGTITIYNTVEKEKYTVYKMFDFEPVANSESNGRYTVVPEWAAFIAEGGDGAAYLAVDPDAGTIVWVGDNSAERKAELAKLAVAYAKDPANNITGREKTADGTTVVFDGVDLGYYAVDTSLGALCALTNTNNTAEVTEKNSGGTITKEVQEDSKVINGQEETTGWGETNDADIGQTVEYKAIITAGKGTTNYVMHDTMSAGLTFNNDVVVTLNDTTVDATNYEVKTSDTCGCTFEVDFTPAFEETLAENDKIVVRYSATLNDDAVVAGEGNPNTVYLTYGNNQKTTEDKTVTYTFQFQLVKTVTDGTVLPGATFKLYDAAEGGNEIPLVKEADGVYRVAVTDEEKAAAKDTVIEAGYVTIKGLDSDTYYLEEINAPEGYNKLTARKAVTIDNANNNATVTNNVYENGGVQVINKTGSLLPETGGVGTTIFYVVGSILMLAALVLLVSKKRMASFA